MDYTFLNALSNVTSLAITGGGPDAPIGETGEFDATLPLRPEQCPYLRHLTLGYYFIQEELIVFLIGHSKTLKVSSLYPLKRQKHGVPPTAMSSAELNVGSV